MAGERKVKVFDCPNCGAGVVLRAQGKTLSVTCGSCGSIIDAGNENFQVLSKYNLKAGIKPIIALGTRGTFHGDLWEVIGFVIRKTKLIYSWEEYLLYNPYKGFRWLTQYDGHWNFVTMMKERPDKTYGGAKYQGRVFRLFQTGEATVEYVLGEFYWRVKVGEKVTYADYIAPPFILSSEGDTKEIVWSRGEYVEPAQIAKAFKMEKTLPVRTGIGSCQPFPHKEMISRLWAYFLFFTALLFVIYLVSPHALLWNFGVCTLLLLIPPLCLFLWERNFEQRRWGEESDLSFVVNHFLDGDDE